MDQDELLRHVVETLERLELDYLVTGSVATILFGVFFPGWLASTVVGIAASYATVLWLGRGS